MSDTIVEDQWGLKWNYGGPETDDHLGPGGHETHLVTIARALLPKGGTFVDVGAHVGLYTMRLADKAGCVVSVEAHPDTYERLLSNVELNGFEHIQAVHAAALGVPNLRVVFHDPNEKITGGSTQTSWWANEEPPTNQPWAWSTTLDALLSDAERIDLVKMDIEGGEYPCLQGACSILDKYRPKLIIEMHDFIVGRHNRKRVFDLLSVHEYRIGPDMPMGEGYHIIATPKEVA